MIERQYWAESHRVEHSGQKSCRECSALFRVKLMIAALHSGLDLPHGF
jgi:hypothetical protein